MASKRRDRFRAALVLALLCTMGACTAGTGTPDGTASASPADKTSETGQGTMAPSNLSEDNAAARIGEELISLEEFNFHYYTGIYWFMDSGIASYFGISTVEDIETARYDETTTFAELFRQDTMESLKAVVTQSAAAHGLGLTIDAEKQARIESALAAAASQAASESMETDAFLAKTFGEGMTEPQYRACLERTCMADMWRESVEANTDVSDAVVEAFYRKDRTAYDVVDLNLFFLNGVLLDEEGGEIGGEEQEAYDAEQRSRAADMLSRLTGDNFAELSAEYLAEGQSPAETYIEGVGFSDLGYYAAELAAFMSDDERAAGDTSVLETDDGYFVVQFLSRYLPDTYTVDVRHILLDIADADAEQNAMNLYSQWQSGDANEESFAALVSEHSTDPGSQDTGGLYTNVSQGQMVPTFDAWCFDPSRQPGDSGVVKTDFGYHIMYFVQKNDILRQGLLSAAVNDAAAQLKEGVDSELLLS